eukprot:s658_g36.t1
MFSDCVGEESQPLLPGIASVDKSLEVKQSLRARGKQPDPEQKPKGKGKGRGRGASKVAKVATEQHAGNEKQTQDVNNTTSKGDDAHTCKVEDEQHSMGDDAHTSKVEDQQHSKEGDAHASKVEGQGEQEGVSSPVKPSSSNADASGKRKVEQQSPSKPSPNKAPTKRRAKKETSQDDVKKAWMEQDCMH